MVYGIKQLLKITGGTPINIRDYKQKVTQFTYDSRQIKPGMGFIPTKGANVDGHKFIESAVNQGAAVYFTQYKEFQDKKINFPNGILVDDTLGAFYKVASFNAKRFVKQIIGITGSAGKTTTKFLTGFILSKLSIPNYVPPKNLNGKYGTPLALANIQNPVDIAVIEYAAGEKGEIQTQLGIAKPDVAILISLTLAHSEFLGSLEEIAKEKGILFTGTDKHILPLDVYRRFYANLDGINLTFGYTKEANAYIYDVQVTPHGVIAKIRFNTPNYKGKVIEAQFNFFNKRIFENLAAILLGLETLGIDWEPVVKHLPEFTPYEGRGNILNFNLGDKKVVIVNEAYNANPLSMKNAIESFEQIPTDEQTLKVMVLGDMKELGEFSNKAHDEIAQFALTTTVPYILIWGPEFKEAVASYNLGSRIKLFNDILEVKGYIRHLLEETKHSRILILVKASNSMRGFTLWEDWQS